MTNEELDRKCAEAQGWTYVPNEYEEKENPPFAYWSDGNGMFVYVKDYTPTTNPAQAMELLKEFKISLSYHEVHEHWEGGWLWDYEDSIFVAAPTPQLAICMAVAAYAEAMMEEKG